MIKNDNILAEVEASYQTARNTRDFNLSVLREKLLNIPQYKEVSERLSALIYDCNKAEFNEDYLLAAKLQKSIDTLKEQKRKIEADNGADSFDYQCKLCADTGELDGKKCSCFYKKVTTACYKELSLQYPKLATFKDDVLSKKVGTDKYYEKFREYANNFKLGSKNVIFTGKTGTGKTFLSQAVASEIAKFNNIALYVTASSLNDIAIENMYASPAIQKSSNDVLTTCDFLVIDDLGAERFLNKITVENLYVLISQRNDLNKPYLITTNLNMEELQSRYGDRLFSRITGKNTVIVNFDGVDLRKLK